MTDYLFLREKEKYNPIYGLTTGRAHGGPFFL
jgi:hypothetical protein